MLKMNKFCPVNPQEDISHGNFKNGLVSALNRQDALMRSATQRLRAARVMVNLRGGGNLGASGAQGYCRGGLAAVLPGGLVEPGWAVSADPLLGVPMLDIAGHHTAYIPVTAVSLPGYRNLGTALTPELAGEG